MIGSDRGPALPAPSADALAFSDALVRQIADEIAAAGGWIGFDRFMARALYAPGMGYYSGGAHKFGAAGDFITAPEISPAFGETLANQAAQVMALSAAMILEVGAGSGRLAADLLRALERKGTLPERYAILDLSGELRARQRDTLTRELPHLVERVVWLDRLPECFDGLVLANELLDALPVQLVRWEESEILERGVAWEQDRFVWCDRPATGRLADAARHLAAETAIPPGYVSEIGLAAADWTHGWGDILGRGALVLIDYGFPRHEYYHPQRSAGTLMCHYRHRAHDDPFFLPGLQDITAHVDFTAIVEAGFNAGLDFLGYTLQENFLVNCGIGEWFERAGESTPRERVARSQALQKLLSPAEMGELFKVVALGKGIDELLIGFAVGDRSETL
ncbi:class I SAM-dependent methyltransferase [Propionivibrio dicarboxylicus]|uniref:SAM-dependent methyltransferase, MidA family n=1 Tax=Propionivibrio dicarboxylicus TaxID=83767 RepID=A0A1G7W435_9RHOO|nr:SAM-dependent methyltransferase [Propionivibrio dicarboxylicus]SDG66678.1 SAM-dependent methyltransferase, MidA family [Propionivibrio dicarboxylicus]